MLTTVWLWYRSCWIIQKSLKCIFEWSKMPKGGFLDLVLLDRLDIAYDDRTKCVPTLRNLNRSRKIVQKCQKCIFEWSKMPKKEVFGHFLDLGLLDWLDIAYYDRTKCGSTVGNTTRSWRIIQKSHKSIFEWSKVPKMSFLAFILSLVCWIDLILHIVIVLNILTG